MSDSELLLSCGHSVHSRKQKGCFQLVWWNDSATGEIVQQGRLVDRERTKRARKRLARNKKAKPVRLGLDDRCQCTCADTCPLGRIGMGPRCTRQDLVAEGIRVEILR